VIAHLTVALNEFNASKADERLAGRNTAAARVDPLFFQHGIYAVVIAAARELFPSGLWLDKTPNSNIVYLAPRLRKIWPNARFIFMKRRGIENIASRMRKFKPDFAHHCREWTAVMNAWLSVRDQLAGVAAEIDQSLMANDAESVATEIARHLSLSETERTRIARILAAEHPQRTAQGKGGDMSFADVGWTSDQVRVFQELCGSVMQAYGYTEAN
jgi:hypothetical protein